MRTLRAVAVAVAGVAVGFAVGTLPQDEPVVHTHYQVVVRTVEVETPVEVVEPEPAEVTLTVEEYEAETACLWEFMQKHDLDMSPGMVLAATEATRKFGGACYLMADDNE